MVTIITIRSITAITAAPTATPTSLKQLEERIDSETFLLVVAAYVGGDQTDYIGYTTIH